MRDFWAQVCRDYGNIYFEEFISSFSHSKNGFIFIINIVHDNPNHKRGKTKTNLYNNAPRKLPIFLMTSLFSIS